MPRGVVYSSIMRFFAKNTDDKRNLLMKRLGALLASLLLAGSLTACGGTAAQEMQSIQVFAMDTVMGLRRRKTRSTAWMRRSPAPGRTAQCPG